MSHYDDEDQAQRLKQWWKENWKALAAGLLLGLGGIIGWDQYKAHGQAKSAEASLDAPAAALRRASAAAKRLTRR